MLDAHGTPTPQLAKRAERHGDGTADTLVLIAGRAPLTTLGVRARPDAVIDLLGHDPRSWYVETFWLGVLGPSTTWLLRRLAEALEGAATPRMPDEMDGDSGSPEVQMSVAELARGLGLGCKGGRNSALARAIQRAVQFDLAALDGDGTLAVRAKLPPLNRRQVQRLPDGLRARHDDWERRQLHPGCYDAARRRSRQLALSLLELGEGFDATELQLLRWRYHPAVAHEAAQWAFRRHLSAGHATEPTEAAAGQAIDD
jgi:hypothetical protein